MRPEPMPDAGGCSGIVVQLFLQGLFPSLHSPPQVGMPPQPVSLRARLASIVFWGVLIALTALAFWGWAK